MDENKILGPKDDNLEFEDEDFMDDEDNFVDNLSDEVDDDDLDDEGYDIDEFNDEDENLYGDDDFLDEDEDEDEDFYEDDFAI